MPNRERIHSAGSVGAGCDEMNRIARFAVVIAWGGGSAGSPARKTVLRSGRRQRLTLGADPYDYVDLLELGPRRERRQPDHAHLLGGHVREIA